MTTDGPAATPTRQGLEHGWQICATPPGRFASPAELDAASSLGWTPIAAPTTVAAALRERGDWQLEGPARRFDAEDWWFRVSFGRAPDETALRLGFDGLGGVAEAWLNGAPLPLASPHNMFVRHECDIGALARPGSNDLVLRFASLDAWLARRRPRPRWRVPMLEQQQLRWSRNTLLGRTPGWSPPAAAVGPWRAVWIERGEGVRLVSRDLRVSVDDNGDGQLDLSCEVAGLGAGTAIELELEREGTVHRTLLQPVTGSAGVFHAGLRIPAVARWWPHTHGEPARYGARLLVRAERHRPAAGRAEPIVLSLPPIGFRTVQVDTTQDGFDVRINGERVFCRGACWSPLDVVSLQATPEAYAAAIAQVRAAGMNMLRVSGTMVYEPAAFFDACDAHGVMVWQDFMFANMDYPAEDTDFLASVEAEVRQQLAEWQGRPSLTVLCGNSEVEQQAAMWGAPRELWSPTLFHEILPRWVHERLPGLPYWPSSAHGGAFPHQPSAGTTSYYGVGAYLRPLADARRAAPRFATECLAFANVPEAAALARMPGGSGVRVHHPAWKARVPRDLGAGWDFDDVRDHYLASLYGVDVLKCRYADHERYLALSRVVTGEVMRASFDEWRRPGSACSGALVLLLRDLWAGAGWGLLDETGAPKACFYQLRRALQPVSLSISDEGNNGLVAHVLNEPAAALEASLVLQLFGPGDAPVAQVRRALQLPGRGAVSIALAELLDHFYDLSYAFRFGPAPVSVVHLALVALDGDLLGETFFLPEGPGPGAPRPLGLAASVERDAQGGLMLQLSTMRFAHSVFIELDGHTPEDNHFHLAPGSQRRIALHRLPSFDAGRVPRGQVGALNADQVLAIHGPA